MVSPERFSDLPAYAFPRLRALLDAHKPGGEVIHMSIGEPKHPFPAFVTEVVMEHAAGFNSYPPNDGTFERRLLRGLECLRTGDRRQRIGVRVRAFEQAKPELGTENSYNFV